MGSPIKDVMWWGWGVFIYVFKISLESIYLCLCLGLGYLWVYCNDAVLSVIWNDFQVNYGFRTDLGSWVLRVERNFLLLRYAFRCTAKRDRRCFLWIMGRWLMLTGRSCYQFWSMVSLNHRQISYKRGIGTVENGGIYMVTLGLSRWFYKRGGLIWYKFMATICNLWFNLHGDRCGLSILNIIMLDSIICSIIKLFLHGVLITKMWMSCIGFSLGGSVMESSGYWKEKIFSLYRMYGQLLYDCMDIMRLGRQAQVLADKHKHKSLMGMEIL